ncbi:MAG TPA: hypothetical protein VII84_11040 [Acidimicrobiales bacterium]
MLTVVVADELWTAAPDVGRLGHGGEENAARMPGGMVSGPALEDAIDTALRPPKATTPARARRDRDGNTDIGTSLGAEAHAVPRHVEEI